MQMKKHIVNQTGLTLVEILAAITIITLIIIFLGNLLPLMAKTNQVNEKKMEAVQLAKEQLSTWQEYFQAPETNEKPNKLSFNGENLVAQYPLKNSYTVKVTIYGTDDYERVELSRNVKAHQIHVQIFGEENNMITETYGYIFTNKPLAEFK